VPEAEASSPLAVPLESAPLESAAKPTVANPSAAHATSDSPALVEVDGLSKSYGSIRALDDVSFRVEEGQIVGFLGPNGAGKSTTLRILAGFLPGDRGVVRVAGHDVRRDSLAVRRQIGYLPEGVPIYPDLRVVEYLRFRARLKGIPWRTRQREIDRCLAAADVADVRRRIIGTLSRGYRQRVGLADALLGEPRVLILDEPTVGLDPEQVRHFRTVLRDVGRDRTVILSTHILQEVELVCSHVVIIRNGKIAAQDRADRLRGVFGERARVGVEIAGPPREVERILASVPGVSRVEIDGDAVPMGVAPMGVSPKGVAPSGESVQAFRRFRLYHGEDVDPREDVYRAVARAGWSLRTLEREILSLEDVFLGIVGGDA
jgi:ABC-2 type transport system ATP-binding protein